MRSNYVALFRDPRVGEMLRGASGRVQAFFKASGFGMDSYDSGAPEGQYPKEDEAAWEDVVARLNENFERHPFTKEELNGFDIGAFLSHQSKADRWSWGWVNHPLSDRYVPNPHALYSCRNWSDSTKTPKMPHGGRTW